MNGAFADLYRVTGPDGNTYGPVRHAILASWVREGRVTRATLVQRGEEPPVEAGSLPELASAFPTSQPFPPAPAMDAPPFPSAVPIPAAFQPWALIEQAWGLVKQDWMVYGAMYFLMSLLVFMVGVIPYAGFVLGPLLSGPLMVGVWRTVLGRIDGRPPRVEMLFCGFDRFGDAFLAALLTTVLTGIGFALCIVPGLYLSVVWAFALAIVAETRLGFWDAMQASVRITSGHRWDLFLLLLAGFLVLLLGFLVCFIGVFIAAPVCMFALGLAYRFLQEKARSGSVPAAGPTAPAVDPSTPGADPSAPGTPAAEGTA